MDHTIVDENEKKDQPEKGRFIFRNITENQKQKLTNKTSGLIGMMAGAGIFSLFGFKSSEEMAIEETEDCPPDIVPIEDGSEIIDAPVCIYSEAPFAQSVTDEMTFNEAFASAREELGQGGFFEYQGNTYNTYYKEEWEDLSLDHQEAFLTSVHKSADYESIQELDALEPMDTPLEDLEIVEAEEAAVEVEDELIATPISEEQEVEIVDEEVSGGVEYVPMDLNKDGIQDAIATDIDGDDFVDVLAIDANADGIPETYMIDSDDDLTMDTIIIDEQEDGFQGDEPVFKMDQEQVLEIDDFQIDTEDSLSDESLSSNMEEDLPDLDNDADISDFI